MTTPTAQQALTDENAVAWAAYFRKTEPKVAEFIAHVEWARGEKFNDNQVYCILKPVLQSLIIGERIRLGPNFTGKPE